MNQKELLQLIDRAAAEEWTELDLSDQGLTELPPEIGKLTNLTSLDLKNNKLTGIGTYYDAVSDVDLDVKQLLAGVETPVLRRERQIQERLLTYTLDELAQLCFAVDVDYDELAGQTKSAKTRVLVQFMGRRDKLDVLETALR